MSSKTPRVLSIQSHVVSGYVGNKSATFPLQLLGFDVDPINSVQFSNNTAYSVVTGQRLDGSQLNDLIQGLDSNNLLEYTHLLTGYIGSASFLTEILKVVDLLRKKNPGLIYVCDPVMGDVFGSNYQGQLYVPQELPAIFRDAVVPNANFLLPNQFECEQLSGVKITSVRNAAEACDVLHDRGVEHVVITSLHCEEKDKITILGSSKDVMGGAPKRFFLKVPRIERNFTGTGDLTSALVLAWMWRLGDLRLACEKAIASVNAVLQNTMTLGTRELALVQSKKEIENPPPLIATPL